MPTECARCSGGFSRPIRRSINAKREEIVASDGYLVHIGGLCVVTPLPLSPSFLRVTIPQWSAGFPPETVHPLRRLTLSLIRRKRSPLKRSFQVILKT